MFTPPPSPLPLPRIVVTDDVPALIDEDQEVKTSHMNVEKGLLAVPSPGISMPSSQQVAMELAEERYQEKRRTATTNPPSTMYAKEGSVTCIRLGEFVSV